MEIVKLVALRSAFASSRYEPADGVPDELMSTCNTPLAFVCHVPVPGVMVTFRLPPEGVAVML